MWVRLLCSAIGVAAALVSVFSPPASVPSPRPDPPRGVPLAKGAVVAALQKACDGDDIAACFRLARLHWEGTVTGWIDNRKASNAVHRAVEIDKPHAFSMNRAACNGGSAAGCYNLAVLYADEGGIGSDLGAAGPCGPCDSRCVGADQAAATVLYERACSLGDKRACEVLGWRLFEGDGTCEDRVEAVRLWRKGCDADDAEACASLGWVYLGGSVFARSQVEAAQLLQKGCDGGAGWACYNLGTLYSDGDGVTRDREEAARLYRLACFHSQSPYACYALATMLLNGQIKPVDAHELDRVYGHCRGVRELEPIQCLALMTLD